MANTLSRQEVNRLALIGAQARLEALRAEINSILRSFPELGRGGSATTSAALNATTPRAKGGQRRRRNWHMSDAQKRAVSERMKKYWAGRRKEKSPAKAAAKKA